VGTSDFSVFGTNLLGATLRQDWLVALGLGVCALKSGRSLWGGALLAYAALVRVFPSEAALFLAVPIVWFAVDQWREHRRLPRLADVRAASVRPCAPSRSCRVRRWRAAALLGPVRRERHLGRLAQKTEIHESGPSANNVGMRNVVSFSGEYSAAGLSRKNVSTCGPNGTLAARDLLGAPAAVLSGLPAGGRTGAHRVPGPQAGASLPHRAFAGAVLFLSTQHLPPLRVSLAAPSWRWLEQKPNASATRAAVVLLALLAVCQAFTAAEQWNDLRYNRPEHPAAHRVRHDSSST